MNRWIDKKTNVRLGGWMGGWEDGWMEEQEDEWMGRWEDGWMGG